MAQGQGHGVCAMGLEPPPRKRRIHEPAVVCDPEEGYTVDSDFPADETRESVRPSKLWWCYASEITSAYAFYSSSLSLTWRFSFQVGVLSSPRTCCLYVKSSTAPSRTRVLCNLLQTALSFLGRAQMLTSSRAVSLITQNRSRIRTQL